jgi:hypothetical protein
MRPIEARALALTVTVTVTSCSPPPSPAETPAITPSASAAIVPTASAAPAIPVAPAEAVARPKDWMWEVLGSTRAVHLRARTADGLVACERYRLEPTGLPASFQGTLVLDDDAQPLRVEATYEGNPPQLSAPRAQLGKATVPLDCEESSLDWYLSEEACVKGGESPLRGAGCASVTSREARDGARRMLAGETRLALVTRLATAKQIWRGASCEEIFVREGKEPSFSGAAAKTASLSRAGKPVFLFLETARDDYPSFVSSGASGSLILDETPDRNPHRVFKHGAGDIAIGCCRSASYDVLDVTPERARLRARRGPRDSGTRPLAEMTWFFEKAACEVGRAGK